MDKRRKLAHEIRNYLNRYTPDGFEKFKILKEQNSYTVMATYNGEIHALFEIFEDRVIVSAGACDCIFDSDEAAAILKEAKLPVTVAGDSGEMFVIRYCTTFDRVADDIPLHATALLVDMLESVAKITKLSFRGRTILVG